MSAERRGLPYVVWAALKKCQVARPANVRRRIIAQKTRTIPCLLMDTNNHPEGGVTHRSHSCQMRHLRGCRWEYSPRYMLAASEVRNACRPRGGNERVCRRKAVVNRGKLQCVRVCNGSGGREPRGSGGTQWRPAKCAARSHVRMGKLCYNR